MGPPGSGKTSALVTFAKAGVETFVLCTEGNGPNSLIDAAERLNVSMDLLHWHVVKPAPTGFSTLKEMTSRIRAMNFEDLSNLKSGIEKMKMTQIDELLDSIADFPCDRTGKRYGDATEWGDTRCFALDSLSGLNTLAWQNTVGYKPTAHKGEWGIAMNLEAEIVRKLATDCSSYFVLTAHIEREPDQLTGGTKIYPGALGAKLGPKLGKDFNDVVRASNTATKGFLWSTTDDQSELKHSSLPRSVELKPDFAPLIAVHKARKTAASSSSFRAAS